MIEYILELIIRFSMNKSVLIAIIIAVLALGGAYWASRGASSGEKYDKDDGAYMQNDSSSGSTEPAASLGMPVPAPGNEAVEEKVVTNTPAPAPAPAVKSYTTSEVAKHNSDASCWSIVRGKVYDLTSWINKHPGGKRAILSMCGVDATEEFSEEHGGDSKPESVLTGYEIGVLAN